MKPVIMETPSKKSSLLTLEQQIQEIEEELKILNMHLHEPQFFGHASAHDYDIKSQIIEKQNQMIELLIKLANKDFKK
jgi:uncharacterized protein YfkK (UPF0435 family)